MLDKPIIATVTPALLAAEFPHLKDVYAKSMEITSNNVSHIIATCSPWKMELVVTKASFAFAELINFTPLKSHPAT